MAAQRDLLIERGKTFSQIVRWETLPIVYKPVTGISQTAPAVITAPGHGMVTGWRAALSAVKGMAGINAQYTPPKAKDYHLVTVVDTNNISMPDVNAAEFAAYVSGGFLQYNSPADMTGCTAQLLVMDSVSGATLQTLTSGAGDLVLDNVGKTITINMNQTNTGLIAWGTALYTLDVIKSTGDPLNPTITPLLYGSIQAVNHL